MSGMALISSFYTLYRLTTLFPRNIFRRLSEIPKFSNRSMESDKCITYNYLYLFVYFIYKVKVKLSLCFNYAPRH